MTDDQDVNSDTSIIDAEEFAMETGQTLSTSAVLSHCKKKILLPYQRVLAAMGLRALNHAVSSSLFLTLMFIILLGGYVLQYMSCFRRDLGFRLSLWGGEVSCSNSIIYSHIIPSLLHLAAFLQALLTLRVRETERLETLMERTFLLAAHRSAGMTSTSKLVRNLWLCIVCSLVWVLISVILVIVVLATRQVIILWVSAESVKITIHILLVITTLWHDLLQATIVTSYCLQVLLLSYSLTLLRSKLLQHSYQPLGWLREVSECQQSIKYLNQDMAPAVSVLCLLNASWAGAGLNTLIQSESKVDPITCIIVGTWSVIAVAPVAAACHLTSSCGSLRGLGHEIRARPFVYQSTPAQDLDTLLLFTSSLRMRAKLCGLPIMAQYIFLIMTAGFVCVLVLGQCHWF